MEYQKKEDSYDEYKKYSNTVLKMQQISSDGPVQGYSATEKEEQESYAPVETMRMKNADGQFSVGVNRNKEATIAITSDASGPLLRGDRSVVAMNSAKRIREVPDKIFTNSHDEKVSGIVYKEDLVKSPAAMIKTLKTTLENQENVVADAITPFLLSKQDVEAKKEMEDYLRGKLELRQQEEYDIQKEEYDSLMKKIALKEKEEQRLIHNLSAVSEKMKEQAEHLDYDYRKVYLTIPGLSSEEGDEGEDGEGKEREDGEDKEREDEEDEEREDEEDEDVEDEDVEAKM